MGMGIWLAERGMAPDFAIRYAIRGLLKQRLSEIKAEHSNGNPNEAFARDLAKKSIAEFTLEANKQHYEVATRFFQLALGKRLKYSCCFYDSGATSLDEAELAMLELYRERAQIQNGHSILDLGCGWGSFSLWIAEKYRDSRVVGVSNSTSQKAYVLDQAKRLGLNNLEIITADMNTFDIQDSFDRIVSIEMFEHMRNYELLFERVNRWLNKDGFAFVHVFSHKTTPYFFEVEGDHNWMGRYFFTGGIMPSHELFDQYKHLLSVDQRWIVNGKNYAQTSLHWLENMDNNRKEILEIFGETYGVSQAPIWFNRWRIFFLACAELFAFNDGNEWDVSHFLFSKTDMSRTNH